MDPSDQKKTACYDIDVEVEEPLKGQMSSFLLSTANQQEISALDSKVGPEPRTGVGHEPRKDRAQTEQTQAWACGEVKGRWPFPPALLQRVGGGQGVARHRTAATLPHAPRCSHGQVKASVFLPADP